LFKKPIPLKTAESREQTFSQNLQKKNEKHLEKNDNNKEQVKANKHSSGRSE
jgi:hypothetical protein